MHSVRQRKHPKKHGKSTSTDDESSEPKSRRRSSICNWKTGLVALILVIVAFVNLPQPSLSKEAQLWRDSGYFFKHQNNNVFYQDIIQLDEPISLHPVLLIVHGYPTSGYDWKNLIPSLQLQFRRIIIPDMLGFGFSDKPRNHQYSIMDQTSIIEELLFFLKVTDVHILSHDYGDTVTQELLARRQGSDGLRFDIKSICLSNGGILPSSYQPKVIQKLMILPGLNVVAGRLSNWWLFKNQISTLFGPETQPSVEELRDFWRITRHKDGNLVLPLIMEYIIERKVNEDRWVSALQRTSVPLHLIYGPHDSINPPDTFLVAYKEMIPNSGISVLESVGHYPQVEDPVGFLDAYSTFLDKL